jgi:hypothetical protein
MTICRFCISEMTGKSMLLFVVILVHLKMNTMINMKYILNYVAFIKTTNDKF